MLVSYHEEHLISEFYVIYAISHLMILFTELDLWLHQATIMNCNDSVQKKNGRIITNLDVCRLGPCLKSLNACALRLLLPRCHLRPAC